MKITNNVPVYNVSWLNYIDGGTIDIFYEPESKEELIDLCRDLYSKNIGFDIVGHTSNIYFLPSYNTDVMVSTRKVRDFQINENFIIADCGVSVRKLSQIMIEQGVKGFEGLVDLPGTVAASVYGNASCYGCCINDLLISFDVLRPDGSIVTLSRDCLKLSKRQSSFKRGEQLGIILSVKMRRENGDISLLKQKAEQNHIKRIKTQPPSQNNLGSIYRSSNEKTIVGFIVHAISWVYVSLLKLFFKDDNEIRVRKNSFVLSLIGAKDLIPYVYSWNRYIWKDSDAHRLFWKFHRMHQLLFKRSDFEIEIKGIE